MLPESDAEEVRPPAARNFVTTHWSVVISAKDFSNGDSAAALEHLCRTYQWPLYAYVRRMGYGHHDAQDLTLEFFARLVAKDFLNSVDRSKGRFRSFLLAAMEHFLAKKWRRNQAQKHGGSYTFVSIDAESAEEHYQQVAASALTPEQVFDQHWATTLLEQAVRRLQEEFVAGGKGALFEEIKVFLTGERRADCVRG